MFLDYSSFSVLKYHLYAHLQGRIQFFFWDTVFWHRISYFPSLIRRKSRKLVWQAKLELDMPSVKENINELN